MFGLTRKTDYALVSLARLAQSGSDSATPISARQVAEEYSLPVPQMMNVFKDLQRAGLVHSQRGAQGGYCLAHRPDRIRLISVIEAIEGPVCLTMCCEEVKPKEVSDLCCCALVSRCPVTQGTRRLNEQIIGFLSQITIQDLMRTNVDVPVGRARIGTAPSSRPADHVSPKVLP